MAWFVSVSIASSTDEQQTVNAGAVQGSDEETIDDVSGK